MRFLDLLAKLQPGAYIPKRLASFDPGGTTGVAFFESGALRGTGRILEYNYLEMRQMLLKMKPDMVVCEEYVLYPWARKEQTWSDFPVPRMIGAIELVCQLEGYRLAMQTPADAKAFCTTTKLQEWGYFQSNDQGDHVNDAIRHGCYWLLHRGKRNRSAPTIGKDWAHLEGEKHQPKRSFHSGRRSKKA